MSCRPKPGLASLESRKQLAPVPVLEASEQALEEFAERNAAANKAKPEATRRASDCQLPASGPPATAGTTLNLPQASTFA